MADVNNCLGKRKTLGPQIIFELENDIEELPNSPNSTDDGPVSKVTKKEDTTEASDSNLYQELSQTSVETNISILEKLTELQEENMKLKRQLEEMNSKMCKCNLNLSGSDLTDNKEDVVITVKFHNESIAEEYRNAFIKFVTSFIEFSYIEDNLNINIEKSKNKEIDLVADDKSPSKKRKRKKSKSKSKDLFTVDTTPSVRKMDSILKYESKYSVTVNAEISEKDNQICPPTSTCFNCEQNHSLRDCPEPKNYVKINAARNKMKQQQTNKIRYHTDEDQKYAHYKPGKISTELQEALGICSDELPPYIYRMRVLGYPPGWMEDARITHSNLSLYGIDGKELSRKSNKTAFDPDKVIEYPGFNVPMEKGIKDNYKNYNCPPYSVKHNKSKMLEYIDKMLSKKEDNLESCDMELDNSSDETTCPPGCEPVAKGTDRLSPSLTDLELKKMELLAELGNNNTNGSNVEENTDSITVHSLDEKNTSNIPLETNANDSIKLNDSFIIIDDTEDKETNTLKCNNNNHNNDENDISVNNGEMDSGVEIAEATTPKSDCVKSSTFGTPMVKGASPYNKLPDPTKFSKDISPVINFENLPNATGKYEQMSGIIQKIRRTLKSNNDN